MDWFRGRGDGGKMGGDPGEEREREERKTVINNTLLLRPHIPPLLESGLLESAGVIGREQKHTIKNRVCSTYC